MYKAPATDVEFGDIFSADWLFDAYLRKDAVPLVAFQTKQGGSAWRPAEPSNHRDLLLSHGRQHQAIILSDNCEIETLVRRGAQSRLVFAAIEPVPISPTQAEEALATRAFRRFPLPPDTGYAGGIVELQRLFAVGVDAVRPADGENDPRIVGLGADLAAGLEMRWNAFATRRGPLAHLDAAEKLARLLTADGDGDRLERLHEGVEEPIDEAKSIAKAVAQALAQAWSIEGADLNEVSDAYEVRDNPALVRALLADSFRELGSRAQRAAALLAPLADP